MEREPMTKNKVAVIGVGGGAGRILTAWESLGEPGDLVRLAVNTDQRALEIVQSPHRMLVGGGRTNGLGTGGDLLLGRSAAEDEAEAFRKILSDTALLVVVASLGGGTGGGAGPVLIQLARETGAMTLAVLTMPFAFEGARRREQAEAALQVFKDAGGAVIVMPNDQLADWVGGGNIEETFLRVDALLARSLAGIVRLLTCPGYLNLDFADLARVLSYGREPGLIGYAEGDGADRVGTAVGQLLSNPILDQAGALERAKALLISIAGGEDLTLKEIDDVMKAVAGRVPSSCEIFAGTAIHSRWNGRLCLTAVLATDRRATPGDAAPVAAPDPVSTPAPEKQRARRLTTGNQPDLPLDSVADRGKFAPAEPTWGINGENLDVPTYQRRGVVIDR